MTGKKRLVLTNTLIDNQHHQLMILLDEQRKPVEISAKRPSSQSIVGNVYVARVLQVVHNINGAFLEIAPGQSAYYSLEDFENVIFTKNQNQKQELCQGDEIVVQVTKDAIKTKDPVVTTNITFASEHVMLTSGKKEAGISRKITGQERNRIKEVLQNLTLPCGVIVRTNGKDCTNQQLTEEILTLVDEYHKFYSKVVHMTCYTLLRQSPPAYILALRSLIYEDMECILTDQLEIYNELLEYVTTSLELAKWKDKLTLYEDEYSLDKLYGITSMIQKACDKLVWLPSGGTLVIEPTEAMTVIDVNSGKNIKKKKHGMDFFEMNLEASREVLRQLRLRNLSGIIVVDFINMPLQEQKEELLQQMRRLAKEDPVKVTIVDITRLGLVEITREKKHPSLYQQLHGMIF